MLRFYLILLAVVISGCASRSSALQDSVENYAKAIRRGDPELALSMVSPDKRSELAKIFDRIDQDLMISQVEVKSVIPDEKMENAVVTFLMEYFDQSSSHLVVLKAASYWKYNDKSKAWLLESTTPLK